MSEQPLARTDLGPVRGLARKGVLSFRGIRFGEPPTGERRFAPARPAGGWTGEYDATEYGPTAPQASMGIEAVLGGGSSPQDEDCLFLNVCTPACDDGRRPVMVWVHGGAFEGGSGSIPWYHGVALAQRGAVVVTINYRLGALGFLRLADLGVPEAGGSIGIADQVLALQWVHDHIGAFGGDPGNVTIFGESAGGMSVGTLLGVPAARGLFHKAIAQSGAAQNLHTPDDATAVAERFCDAAGIADDPAAGARRLSVAEVLSAQAKASAATVGADQLLAWQPTVDGDVVPRPPLGAVRDGAVADVPLLTGTTRDEMRLFAALDPTTAELDEERLLARMAKALGDRDAAAALTAAYRRRLGDGASPSDVWLAASTDRVFRIPAIRLAEAQAAHQPDTRMYLFAAESKAFGGTLGSCHALELPFMFDAVGLNGVSMLVGPVTEAHHALAKAMADAWVSFAADGVPSAAGLPEWPAYDPDGGRATMQLDVDRCAVVDDPYGDERLEWERLRDQSR